MSGSEGADRKEEKLSQQLQVFLFFILGLSYFLYSSSMISGMTWIIVFLEFGSYLISKYEPNPRKTIIHAIPKIRNLQREVISGIPFLTLL